jgi:L-ascorbate metabolism protein UlaG (beta-lactamase superfamily)
VSVETEMRILKRILVGLGLIILLGAGWVYFQFRSYPDLSAYRGQTLPSSNDPTKSPRIVFLGVSTLLFDDGETAILTDGFFTRPSNILFGKISPDKVLIAKYLKRAGISKLAAVIVCHSHYDHAMDSPEVALQTGAVLVGSESTANVGRGWGLPEDRIWVRAPGTTMTFGKFRVTLLATSHVPPGYPGGEITAPLVPSVRANAYLQGTNYAVLVEHSGKSYLISASAGFTPGSMANTRADVVFLGIGTLGKRQQAYMESYWREVVEATGARRVIPIHWDNFILPLDEPLRPLPHLIDDFDASMRFLVDKGAKSGVEVKLPQAWESMDPFAKSQ